ncbi:MAG: 23S rRNA (uracil(1939)-C(5))-methyltransferase RlmD [Lachnospiraceae bacterium]|nr:23S rRNA (uracil(1939)-C(5))-methyltransferase RlmD [Lachnospiraceae bacterium]
MEKKCLYNKKCGGCQYLHLEYKKQLEKKQKEVSSLLKSFGKVRPIIGMEDPYHYRNKVHGVVAADRQGNGYTGIYEEKSHRIIRVDSCLIENQKADEIMQSVAGLMKSFKMKPFNEDTGYGFLRHILIRTGYHTGEVMVVLVTASPVFLSKNNFVKALRKKHPEITTIVANVNDRRTSMVLGDKQQVLYGKGYIEDVLCGKRFRISPKSFYQVNPVQTEVLYGKAIEYAGLTGKETVIDAYSGIGTIGMIASDHAKQVISVELNGDAVRDAISNAKINKIKNIQFCKADAGDFMVQMAARGQKADVVFMDPPRAGSDKKFMDSLLKLAPKKVVYVSCNPETLKRDLAYLTSKGYRVKETQPVDMFPMTVHTENVCLLIK